MTKYTEEELTAASVEYDNATWVEKGSFIEALNAALSDGSPLGGRHWQAQVEEAVQAVIGFFREYEGTTGGELGDRFEGR